MTNCGLRLEDGLRKIRGVSEVKVNVPDIKTKQGGTKKRQTAGQFIGVAVVLLALHLIMTHPIFV